MRYVLIFILFTFSLSADGIDMIGKKGAILPFKVIKTINGVEVRQGGYGSSAFGDIHDKNRFYGLTDKGIEGIVPKIAHFEIGKNGKIKLLHEVSLKGKLNPEGLVVLKDGTFWISDEFGPNIIHFDKKGNEIERIDFLPLEVKNRRPNHGFEGLAITKDEKTLVAIMQSSLQNPNKKTKRSKLTRIITLDLKSKKVGQYLYKLDKKKNSNSEIRAIDYENFLVIERDSKNPLKSKNAQKKIYKISLKNATNLEKIASHSHFRQDEDLGLLLDGKPLEAVVLKRGWKYLKKRGIYPVRKTLFMDLVKQIGYVHDKPEGMWILGKDRVCVINDDDFGVRVKKGRLKQKYLKKPTIDMGRVYVIKGGVKL